MSRMRWTAIWTFHLKCHTLCLSVILLCYRTCLWFCNKWFYVIKSGIICDGPLCVCVCVYVLFQECKADSIFKILINVIHHISRLKKKMHGHTNWDRKDISQNSMPIRDKKNSQKVGIKDTFFNLTKSNYRKPTDYFIFSSGRLNAFPQNWE